MAEILVSDLCDLSPAAARRRVFRCPKERGPLVHCSLDCFRIVFLIALHCFVSMAFLLAITSTYIVFWQIFALQIACIFVRGSCGPIPGKFPLHLQARQTRI